MNIYLDIDGVLLHDGLDNAGSPVNHAIELLKYLTDNYTVYWLTTHCRDGENHAQEVLLKRFPPETKVFLDKIIPTDWDSWKTDAIDFTQDFRWIDDDVYKPEYDVLAKNNASDKLIEVDLRNNPEQLFDIMETLTSPKS